MAKENTFLFEDIFDELGSDPSVSSSSPPKICLLETIFLILFDFANHSMTPSRLCFERLVVVVREEREREMKDKEEKEEKEEKRKRKKRK